MITSSFPLPPLFLLRLPFSLSIVPIFTTSPLLLFPFLSPSSGPTFCFARSLLSLFSVLCLNLSLLPLLKVCHCSTSLYILVEMFQGRRLLNMVPHLHPLSSIGAILSAVWPPSSAATTRSLVPNIGHHSLAFSHLLLTFRRHPLNTHCPAPRPCCRPTSALAIAQGDDPTTPLFSSAHSPRFFLIPCLVCLLSSGGYPPRLRPRTRRSRLPYLSLAKAIIPLSTQQANGLQAKDSRSLSINVVRQKVCTLCFQPQGPSQSKDMRRSPSSSSGVKKPEVFAKFPNNLWLATIVLKSQACPVPLLSHSTLELNDLVTRQRDSGRLFVDHRYFPYAIQLAAAVCKHPPRFGSLPFANFCFLQVQMIQGSPRLLHPVLPVLKSLLCNNLARYHVSALVRRCCQPSTFLLPSISIIPLSTQQVNGLQAGDSHSL